jgi:hypothetical protein
MKAVYFIKEYGKFKSGDKVKLDGNVMQALLKEGVVSFTYPVEVAEVVKPKRVKK